MASNSKSAVVLLSGGLDSTVNLFKAHREMNVLLALSFDFGQRAAEAEIRAAQGLSEHLQVPHKVVPLPWLREITKTDLVNPDAKPPVADEVSIDDFEVSQKTAARVWVPNRNGAFLNIAAAFAESLGADYVVPGFNLEEATTFPDNSEDYLQALDHSFSFSTATKVKTNCFTTAMNKTEIVVLGKELQVPFELIWSCYFNGEKPCGQCESCQRSRRAYEAAGLEY